MKKTALFSLTMLAASFAFDANAADKKLPGYTDTPIIPGQKWRVHDANRPRPKVVKAGPSKTLGAKPPKGAVVLFNGEDTSQWSHQKWKVEKGYMEVTKGSGQLSTKKIFGSIKLHIEFATPIKVVGNSQGRGNSGVFFCGQYEVQVLDSYQNMSYADGQCAALYGQHPPLVNVCRPPGEWQTYDLTLVDRHVTVVLNGVKVIDNQPVEGPTGGAVHTDPMTPGPLHLQGDHTSVKYKNIYLARVVRN